MTTRAITCHCGTSDTGSGTRIKHADHRRTSGCGWELSEVNIDSVDLYVETANVGLILEVARGFWEWKSH